MLKYQIKRTNTCAVHAGKSNENAYERIKSQNTIQVECGNDLFIALWLFDYDFNGGVGSSGGGVSGGGGDDDDDYFIVYHITGIVV